MYEMTPCFDTETLNWQKVVKLPLFHRIALKRKEHSLLVLKFQTILI